MERIPPRRTQNAGVERRPPPRTAVPKLPSPTRHGQPMINLKNHQMYR
jgi:hypothetical protein